MRVCVCVCLLTSSPRPSPFNKWLHGKTALGWVQQDPAASGIHDFQQTFNFSNKLCPAANAAAAAAAVVLGFAVVEQCGRAWLTRHLWSVFVMLHVCRAGIFSGFCISLSLTSSWSLSRVVCAAAFWSTGRSRFSWLTLRSQSLLVQYLIHPLVNV